MEEAMSTIFFKDHFG